jgi:hypothetical protein
MNRTFKEYLDIFMEAFLDNFIVYNDMENHLVNVNCALKMQKVWD